MKKLIAILAITSLFILTLTGCEKSMSYTFNIETNEQIKVKLNTTDGEKLSQEDGKFTIKSKDGEVMSAGIFFLPEVFNELYESIDKLDNVEIIKIDKEDNLEYTFYKVVTDTTTEWNYLIKPNGAKAGIIVSNITSEKSAKKAFELLTFKVNPN